MASEEDVLNFAASSIGSVWALELLLLMKQEPRTWSSDELVLQLRGSDSVIAHALQHLLAAELIGEDSGGFRYNPASAEKETMANDLEELYRIKPVTVVSAIANAPQRKLQILSDAFRLKKD